MQLPLISTIVIAVLSVFLGALAFSRKRSWRGLLRGIGVAAFTVGSWFLGFMELLVNGAKELVTWISQVTWNQQAINASITIGTGLALFVVAGFLSPGQSAGDQKQDPERSPEKIDKPEKKAIRPSARPVRSSGLDAQDAEIEALLKARGIE